MHATHHIYNKEHTLSPFAGLAFHPLDGICQAAPYTWTLFFCPMHFFSHELLLFLTGEWVPACERACTDAPPEQVLGFVVMQDAMYRSLYELETECDIVYALQCAGVWTTNIHDCVHGKVWPIMGAGYHLIHHTTYKHNYG